MTVINIGNNVTSIGSLAFYGTGLRSITFSGNLTGIGDDAFNNCTNLTSVSIPNSVTSLGTNAFYGCTGLTNVSIGNNVVNIGTATFYNCVNLTSINIGNNVTSIGDQVFYNCPGLNIHFSGRQPSLGSSVFTGDMQATAYYLPGTSGWGATFGGLTTAFWFLPNPLVLSGESSFGVRTNRFGFTISWATNVSVVVEACTNFANPVWIPMSTNTLISGSSYFSDSKWTNSPGRYYRLRSM